MVDQLLEVDAEPRPPLPPPRGRRLRVVAAVAAVLLAATGLAWVVERSTGPDATETSTDRPNGAQVDEFTRTLREQLALTPGEADCVRDRSAGVLDEDRVLELVADPDEAEGRHELDGVLGACAFDDSGGETSAAGGAGFGDDPVLDGLWNECSDTGTDACDQLYNASPEGSEYERFADTCGGRGTPQVACAPDALASAGPDGPSTAGGADELDLLRDECIGGDTQACLALAFQAPAGSEAAELGARCAEAPDDPMCARP